MAEDPSEKPDATAQGEFRPDKERGKLEKIIDRLARLGELPDMQNQSESLVVRLEKLNDELGEISDPPTQTEVDALKPQLEQFRKEVEEAEKELERINREYREALQQEMAGRFDALSAESASAEALAEFVRAEVG